MHYKCANYVHQLIHITSTQQPRRPAALADEVVVGDAPEALTFGPGRENTGMAPFTGHFYRLPSACTAVNACRR